jgi:thiol-disulfide isomerase/thioredoxin
MSIVNILYRDYIRPYKNQFTILLFFILFCVVGYYAYRMMAKPIIDNRKTANIANMAQRSEEVQIYLFYADWCPHCTKAKPEWNTFKEEFDGSEMNGYAVQAIEVDCTETTTENSPLIQKFGVDSFPTVKMMKSNQVIDFDSKVTSSSLTQFINSMLQ